jgi:hypothetical protein
LGQNNGKIPKAWVENAFTNDLVAVKNKSNNHGKRVKDHEKAALNEKHTKGHPGLEGTTRKRSKNHEILPEDQESTITKAAKESLRQNNGKIPKERVENDLTHDLVAVFFVALRQIQKTNDRKIAKLTKPR